MIECTNCGHLNQNDDRFCGECGNKLSEPANYCPNCNKTYYNNNKFCTQCGTKLVVKSDYLKPNSPKKHETIKSQPSVSSPSRTIKRQSDISNKHKTVNRLNIQKSGPSVPPDNFIKNLMKQTIQLEINPKDNVSMGGQSGFYSYSRYSDGVLEEKLYRVQLLHMDCLKSGEYGEAKRHEAEINEIKQELKRRGYSF